MKELIEGQVYTVEEKNVITMVGRVTIPNNGDNGGSLRGDATFVSNCGHFQINSPWAYYSEGCRTNRLSTPEEVYWLDECIKANRLLNKEDVLKNYKPTYEIY